MLHASFRTRKADIAIDLGTTGDIYDVKKANIAVATHKGDIKINLVCAWLSAIVAIRVSTDHSKHSYNHLRLDLWALMLPRAKVRVQVFLQSPLNSSSFRKHRTILTRYIYGNRSSHDEKRWNGYSTCSCKRHESRQDIREGGDIYDCS